MMEALKNRRGPEVTRAYKNTFDYLTVQVYKPIIHWLYNKALDQLKIFHKENYVKFQLAPPGVHRRNSY